MISLWSGNMAQANIMVNWVGKEDPHTGLGSKKKAWAHLVPWRTRQMGALEWAKQWYDVVWERDRQNGLGFGYRCIFEETKGGREQVEMVSRPLWHWPAASWMIVSPAIHMGSRAEITLLIRAHVTHRWDNEHGRLSSTPYLLYGQHWLGRDAPPFSTHQCLKQMGELTLK